MQSQKNIYLVIEQGSQGSYEAFVPQSTIKQDMTGEIRISF